MTLRNSGQAVTVFKRNLSRAAREAAMSVDPRTYPQDMPCAVCGYRWMQHKGTLCPKAPGAAFPVDMGDHIELVPIEPIYGDTTFIPDADYYNQNPPFEVI